MSKQAANFDFKLKLILYRLYYETNARKFKV